MNSQWAGRLGRLGVIVGVLFAIHVGAHAVWNYNLDLDSGRAADAQACEEYNPLGMDDIVTLNGAHYVEWPNSYVSDLLPAQEYIQQGDTVLLRLSDKDYAYAQFCDRLQTKHWYDYYPRTWKGWVGTHVLGLLVAVLAGLVLTGVGWLLYMLYRYVWYGRLPQSR